MFKNSFRKKGHWKDAKVKWVQKGTGMELELKYRCSRCGLFNLWDTPYCPNCGARMGERKADAEIDADALYYAVVKQASVDSQPIKEVTLDDFCSWVSRIARMIGDAPTIDAEPVEPIEFEWCDSCKEYDQNAHCCHRWTKVIRNTVNDLKTRGYEIVRHWHWENYLTEGLRWKCSECGSRFETPYHHCPNCGAKMDEDDVENDTK